MGKAFGCLALFVAAYVVLKWPIPSLVVFGILFVLACITGRA